MRAALPSKVLIYSREVSNIAGAFGVALVGLSVYRGAILHYDASGVFLLGLIGLLLGSDAHRFEIDPDRQEIRWRRRTMLVFFRRGTIPFADLQRVQLTVGRSPQSGRGRSVAYFVEFVIAERRLPLRINGEPYEAARRTLEEIREVLPPSIPIEDKIAMVELRRDEVDAYAHACAP